MMYSKSSTSISKTFKVRVSRPLRFHVHKGKVDFSSLLAHIAVSREYFKESGQSCLGPHTMAGSFDVNASSMEEMIAKDPTLVVNGIHDQANGEKPNPPERYGEPLPADWIPLYKKPMRTPTRKLRIACIGAGISSMNLAYKIYHEWKDTLGDYTEIVFYEANEDMGGTWLVNQYPGTS